MTLSIMTLSISMIIILTLGIKPPLSIYKIIIMIVRLNLTLLAMIILAQYPSTKQHLA
jgi:hypothetical protein